MIASHTIFAEDIVFILPNRLGSALLFRFQPMAVSQDYYFLKDYATAMGVKVTLSKTNAVSPMKKLCFQPYLT